MVKTIKVLDQILFSNTVAGMLGNMKKTSKYSKGGISGKPIDSASIYCYMFRIGEKIYGTMSKFIKLMIKSPIVGNTMHN
jgi:hypothetical protein